MEKPMVYRIEEGEGGISIVTEGAIFETKEGLRGTVYNIVPIGFEVRFEKEAGSYRLNIESFINSCVELRESFRSIGGDDGSHI